MAEEGMIYESDNMDAVAVKTYYLVDVTEEKTVNLDFSTKAKSVNFREVDDETLGVYIDADNDGIYETLIADSNGNHYDKSIKQTETPENKPEEPESEQSSPAEASSKPDINASNDPKNVSTIENEEISTETASRDESSPLPDKAVPDGSSESTVQSDQSAEPVESSDVMNGTVPVVIAGALAILLAGVIIFRRRNKTRY